ncbi:hypothetical protein CRUP_032131, partial [Coryphaenoides rupestris]
AAPSQVSAEGVVFVGQLLLLSLIGYWLVSLLRRTLRLLVWLFKVGVVLAAFVLILRDPTSTTSAVCTIGLCLIGYWLVSPLLQSLRLAVSLYMWGRAAFAFVPRVLVPTAVRTIGLCLIGYWLVSPLLGPLRLATLVNCSTDEESVPVPCLPAGDKTPEGKSFQLLDGLQSHQSIHWDKPAYRCTMCYKQFMREDDLRDHKLAHLSIEPFQGHERGKRFLDQTTLNLLILQ